MKNINKLNCRQVMYYLNIIAEKEQEHARELAEKDEVIDYYRRAAEQATRSKHRALNRQDEQRKDMIAYAVCAALVAFAVWLGGTAIHTFLLWASGQ
jgi:ferric-dicitrate binding protein FerR (iron transport regulator)